MQWLYENSSDITLDAPTHVEHFFHEDYFGVGLKAKSFLLRGLTVLITASADSYSMKFQCSFLAVPTNSFREGSKLEIRLRYEHTDTRSLAPYFNALSRAKFRPGFVLELRIYNDNGGSDSTLCAAGVMQLSTHVNAAAESLAKYGIPFRVVLREHGGFHLRSHAPRRSKDITLGGWTRPYGETGKQVWL